MSQVKFNQDFFQYNVFSAMQRTASKVSVLPLVSLFVTSHPECRGKLHNLGNVWACAATSRMFIKKYIVIFKKSLTLGFNWSSSCPRTPGSVATCGATVGFRCLWTRHLNPTVHVQISNNFPKRINYHYYYYHLFKDFCSKAFYCE